MDSKSQKNILRVGSERNNNYKSCASSAIQSVTGNMGTIAYCA